MKSGRFGFQATTSLKVLVGARAREEDAGGRGGAGLVAGRDHGSGNRSLLEEIESSLGRCSLGRREAAVVDALGFDPQAVEARAHTATAPACAALKRRTSGQPELVVAGPSLTAKRYH